VPVTQTKGQIATSASTGVGNGPPILVGRKSAAYLTYNTLTLPETPDLASQVVVSPTHPVHLQSERDPRI